MRKDALRFLRLGWALFSFASDFSQAAAINWSAFLSSGLYCSRQLRQSRILPVFSDLTHVLSPRLLPGSPMIGGRLLRNSRGLSMGTEINQRERRPATSRGHLQIGVALALGFGFLGRFRRSAAYLRILWLLSRHAP